MKRSLMIFIIMIAALPVLAADPQTTTITATVFAKPMTKFERAQAYYQQGYLYYLEKQYKEASPEFVKALQQDPKMAKSFYWLGKTNYKLGRYKSTVTNCDSALAINPKYYAAKALKKTALSQFTVIPSSRVTKKWTPKKVTAAATMPVIVGTHEPAAATAESPETIKSDKVDVTIVREKLGVVKPKKKKQLITLDLRNVDISSVLQVFSKETGMNIISGQDVYGKVTVVINNMDADEALDMILKSNGYTYTKDGPTVHVYSSGEPPRLEELPGGVFVRSFTINYMEPDELKDTIIKLMPEDSSIYTTKGSNAIVIKGSADDIRRAEVLIRNLDIPPRQVMVEAKIIEVTLNEAQNLGVNFNYADPNKPTNVYQTVAFAGTPTSTTAKGLYYTVTNDNPSVLVEVLSTRTGFNILSSPKVMALNNQKAEIITGSQLGYKIKTVTPTGVLESIEFLSVGTKLILTPSIKSDGLIVMDIHPEISEGTIVNELPQKFSTETTTQLIVRDGQTIIIGGLIRDTSKKIINGVPILMDIPLIGALFKRTEITSEKREVIVLITPHIINSRINSESEEKVKQVEQNRKDSAPAINLDLLR
jgi:type II secretory pathway component GspD/PulD (secretin)